MTSTVVVRMSVIMFKLSTICIDTASQSPAPLSDHVIVSHMLAEVFPFFHNLLTQFADILDLLVNAA